MIITQPELIIAGIAFACIGAIYRNNLSRLDKTDARLDRIEKRMDKVLDHLKGRENGE